MIYQPLEKLLGFSLNSNSSILLDYYLFSRISLTKNPKLSTGHMWDHQTLDEQTEWLYKYFNFQQTCVGFNRYLQILIALKSSIYKESILSQVKIGVSPE